MSDKPKYLDKVYDSGSDPESQTSLYDAWAKGYDSELADGGYATPGRIAAALSSLLSDKSAPVLDFGCGSGLSGAALKEAGFTTVDGCDLSEGMLDEARDKGIYRDLWKMTAGELDVQPGDYAAIVACGVISVGAAPPETLDLVVEKTGPGGLLVLSLNDHSMTDDSYIGRIERLKEGKGWIEKMRSHGDHLPTLGVSSTVIALERPS